MNVKLNSNTTCQREWQAKNRALCSGYSRKWNAKNSVQKAEYLREWRAKNPTYDAKYTRDWRVKNPIQNSEYQNQWYKNNRERAAKRSKRYRKANPIRTLLWRIEARAKYRDLTFSLTRKWLEKRLEPMCCEVTGVKLDWSNNAKCPSVDRIDCSKGYTMKNCRITSWMYNRARGNFTDKEVMGLLVIPLLRRVEV